MVAFAVVGHVHPAISSEIVSGRGSSEVWKHLETRGNMWDTNHEALNIQMRG